MPGYEARLPVVFDEMVSNGRFDVCKFVEWTSTNPAKIYGLYPRKGTIAIGSDADIAIWDPKKSVTFTDKTVKDRAGYTPWKGRTVKGWPTTVLLRGDVLVENGKLRAKPGAASSSRARPARPPSRSAAPRWSSTRNGISARSCGNGVARSPHGAKRNAGFPDFAALHPGYNSSMKLAFIGASHWHLPLYLEPVLDAPGVTIAGVSDPDPKSVDRLTAKLGCAGDTDYRELCRRVKPDFVIALGRHCDMAEQARFLIAEKIPFALEKPCGLNEREVAAIARAAQAAGAFAAVPLVFRNGEFFDLLREEARQHPVHDLPFHRGLPAALSRGGQRLDARSGALGRRLHHQSRAPLSRSRARPDGTGCHRPSISDVERRLA